MNSQEFFKRTGVINIHQVNGNTIGVCHYIFTYGLLSGYDPEDIENFDYVHRFCYPKEKFGEVEMYLIASKWDGVSMPPDGWAKYKGSLGELSPKDKEKLQELMSNGISNKK